jgi:hypothetical protein
MPGKKNSKLYHAAMEEARRHAESQVLPAVNPAEALRGLLGRITMQLQHASKRVDELREDELSVMTAFGPVDNEWIRVEARLRQELASLCINMERVGLAERLVNIAEARARLIERALVDAAAEAGIPRSKLKAIGPAFRRNLTALQGGGEGGSAPRSGPRRAAA